jgi:hypothetical protein
VHRAALAPADDAPAEHVHHERHVDPALPGRDIGEVRDPELVRPLGTELPVDPVQRAWRLRVRNGGALGLAPAHALQAWRRISRSTVQRATETPSRLSCARPCRRHRPACWPARRAAPEASRPHRAGHGASAVQGCAGTRHGASTPMGRSAGRGRSTRPQTAGGADRRRPSGLDAAVELRLGEKRAGQLQDLVGLAQFAHLALQVLDALGLFGRDPSRTPASTSCCLTQVCSVCGTQPILPAMDSMAAHCDGCSPRCSSTMRTARSRTSGKTSGTSSWLHSPELEPPSNPGRFTRAQARRATRHETLPRSIHLQTQAPNLITGMAEGDGSPGFSRAEL